MKAYWKWKGSQEFIFRAMLKSWQCSLYSRSFPSKFILKNCLPHFHVTFVSLDQPHFLFTVKLSQLCIFAHARLCLTLCDPINSSPPGSSVHGIFQGRILAWVAISSSSGSSWPRDGTCVSCISCFGRWILLPPSHLGSPESWPLNSWLIHPSVILALPLESPRLQLFLEGVCFWFCFNWGERMASIQSAVTLNLSSYCPSALIPFSKNSGLLPSQLLKAPPTATNTEDTSCPWNCTLWTPSLKVISSVLFLYLCHI